MSTATIHHLPDEILRELLAHLNGKDVLNFSKVSLRWQSVVDDLGDQFWRRVCRREYPDIHEDSRRKSGLSWRDLYRSFLLWERVSEAEVRISPCPHYNLNAFSLNFLKNCVISFPIEAIGFGNADTVIYFDAKSHREIKRKCYGFKFTNYIENDDVIAFEIADMWESNKIVRVIPKANEDMATDLESYCRNSNLRSWVLVDDEIFYNKLSTNNERRHVKFCKVKITIKGKEVSYEHSELGDSILDGICAVAYVGEKIHVLEVRELGGLTHHICVATIENGQMIIINHMHVSRIYDSHKEVCKIMEDLKGYGFRSSHPRVTWRINISGKHGPYFKLMTPPVLYGPHLIAGALELKTKVGINVYLDVNNASQDYVRTEPNFAINIVNSKRVKSKSKRFMNLFRINQVEVIETLHGHIIAATYYRKLYIIDLKHNDDATESPVRDSITETASDPHSMAKNFGIEKIFFN